MPYWGDIATAVATQHTADNSLYAQIGAGFTAATGITSCAAPTGVAATDNTNFQAALTAGSGKTIYLRPGTYNLTAAPTLTSFTTIVGDKSTILQCNVTGAMFDLTNLNQVRFIGMYFSVIGTNMTLFKESGNFNCSWSNILATGTHTLVSPQPTQICFDSSNNSGDNSIDTRSEISGFGIGFRTGSFATYLTNSKISNCQYSIYSQTSFSAGMIITDSTLASTPGGVTISHIYIPDSSGKWFITNTDMEGATETLHIGSGVLSHGPTQFSITNCNLEGTTTIMNIQSAYGFTMSGIVFSPDPSATPTSLIINGTGAPAGYAAGLTTNVTADAAVIAVGLFPSGWNYIGSTATQFQGLAVSSLPQYMPTGNYVLIPPATSTSTSAALGNATLRAVPFQVPRNLTVTKIGAEVTTVGDAGRSVSDMVTNGTTTITSATAAFVSTDRGRLVTGTNIATGTYIASVTNGTTAVLTIAATGSGSGGSLVISGCVIRLGIYADNGSGFPGALVIDAGTIDGHSATVQEITISQALSAGTYWFGAVVQGVTTTQPTMRTGTPAFAPISSSTIPATNAIYFGYAAGGTVNNGLPNPFNSPSPSGTGGVRGFIKTT